VLLKKALKDLKNQLQTEVNPAAKTRAEKELKEVKSELQKMRAKQRMEESKKKSTNRYRAQSQVKIVEYSKDQHKAVRARIAKKTKFIADMRNKRVGERV
jgi:hypothetical protein